jgi:hypothetical protein
VVEVVHPILRLRLIVPISIPIHIALLYSSGPINRLRSLEAHVRESHVACPPAIGIREIAEKVGPLGRAGIDIGREGWFGIRVCWSDGVGYTVELAVRGLVEEGRLSVVSLVKLQLSAEALMGSDQLTIACSKSGSHCVWHTS